MKYHSSLTFSQLFKKVKTIPSSQAVRSQKVGWIFPHAVISRSWPKPWGTLALWLTSCTGFLRRPTDILGQNLWECIRMGHTTWKYNCEKSLDRDDSSSYPSLKGHHLTPIYNVKTPLSSFQFPPLLPPIEINCDSVNLKPGQILGRTKMPLLHNMVFCALLTCRVWLKRFNGVAFTGGMRFASDVTLERGLTRLLLGSYRIEKKGNVKVNCKENITTPQSRIPSTSCWLHTNIWNVTGTSL